MVERDVLQIHVLIEDRLGIDRPRPVEILCAGNDRQARAAEKHQPLVTLFDDVSGRGVDPILFDGPKGNDVALLFPRAFERFASGLHRKIGRRRNKLRRRRGVAGCHIKHVPPIAVLDQPRAGGRAGVIGTLRPEREHAAVLFPGLEIFAGGQAGEPPVRSAAIVIEIKLSVLLNDARFAHAANVAAVWPVAVADDPARVGGVQASLGGCRFS